MANSTQRTPFPTADAPGSLAAASGTSAGSGSAGIADPTLSRVVQGAHDAVDRVAEKAAPAVERLKAGVSEAASTVHARADQFGALQEELAENCRNNIRERPLTSVLAAFAAGLLLSRLL